MKKTILTILFCTLFSISATYAKSDIQLGFETPIFNFASSNLDLRNVSLLSISLQNHNFFGEKSNIGVSEYITFSPLTSDLFSQFPGFNLSVFTGSSFKFFTGESKEFILSTGLKYFLNYSQNFQKYPKNEGEEKVLTVTGTKIYSAYAFSLDLQVKFFADKRCSFVLGMPVSIGIGNENFTENVNSINPNSIYKTLSSKSDIDCFFELGFPYFMFCLNF